MTIIDIAADVNATNGPVEIEKVWICNETLKAAELLEKIYEQGMAMEATMFVPIALYIVTVLLTIDLVIFLFKNMVDLRRTACTLWVVGAFPTLCTLAITGLFMPKTSRIIKFSLTFVFAITMKKFFELTLLYYGGKLEMEKTLAGYRRVSPNPFPCCFICCCCRNSRMSNRRIHILEATTYQVIFIYPTIYFIQTLLAVEQPVSPLTLGIVFFGFEFILGFSSLTCMYGYVVLGKASFEPLQQFNIRGKYICLQLLIAFITLQDVTLDILEATNVLTCGFPYPNRSKSFVLHMYLLVSELFLVSVLAWFMFRRSEKDCTVVYPNTFIPSYKVSSVNMSLEKEDGVPRITTLSVTNTVSRE